MRILNDVLLPTQSVTSSATSVTQDIQHIYAIDVMASVTVVSGTIAGSIKLQKSDDPAGTASPVWFDIASSSQSFSGATTLNWAYADVAYPFVRAVVTVSSGTAGITMRINGKGA